MSTQIVAFNFHGDQIVTFQNDGEPYVAMRRVVENLGLSWGSQRTKLAAAASKFHCTDIDTVDAAGRVYPMMSMPVAKLPLWLATINPNKIPDPVKRAKIELYQAESAIALHDYWAKGVAVRGDMDGVVTNLDPAVMKALGGMFKGIVHKEISAILPAMIQSEVMSGRYSIVEGVSALEVAEMAGYGSGQRPRGLTQFITRRVGRFHEDRGVPVRRSRHGSGQVRLFDEATARIWLRNGGIRSLENYVAERNGQGKLRLISGGTGVPK